ncbi:hypothetical protein AO1008_08617 [Aspergillus oryzae 100-8]|uniref:Zn(2)-C6 fungal-type domain-containing protein n=1 Tax=Aspergillus oryzae (strain 3.042) TaxID=1160506 RepID=I8I811_ASPO3|nr:hypothetical protein Ao3042_10969 [Aspergillus oryzae 3.042]KDE82100.1 hypothetical protein AO1008_08617 [Aspergillus oryzae 100-8]|eukprot:EIT73096.1 hypothetical protein Ao3042_10969 [Aspergillus oryzae 3.042]
MQKVHGVKECAPPPKQACTYCRDQKTRCQGGPPCSKCVYRGIDCSLSRQTEVQPGGDSSCPPDTLRSEKERHFLDLYFKLFHPHWPFIHQGSFREDDETPLLVQSMIVIGLWVSKEPNAQSKAVDLHNVLNSAIHQQKEIWDASISKDASSTCSWPIPTYQAILLHIIFAVLYKGSGALGLDLKPSLTPAVADLLHRLVTSCRKLGMLYYPNMLSRYGQNDLASLVWIGIEEIKRFNIALFKVCRAFSSSGEQGSSIDTSWRLYARDLQFPLPRNTPLWAATSREEWDSAAPDDVYGISLNDTLEAEWISKSADVLELTEISFPFG